MPMSSRLPRWAVLVLGIAGISNFTACYAKSDEYYILLDSQASGTKTAPGITLGAGIVVPVQGSGEYSAQKFFLLKPFSLGGFSQDVLQSAKLTQQESKPGMSILFSPTAVQVPDLDIGSLRDTIDETPYLKILPPNGDMPSVLQPWEVYATPDGVVRASYMEDESYSVQGLLTKDLGGVKEAYAGVEGLGFVVPQTGIPTSSATVPGQLWVWRCPLKSGDASQFGPDKDQAPWYAGLQFLDDRALYDSILLVRPESNLGSNLKPPNSQSWDWAGLICYKVSPWSQVKAISAKTFEEAYQGWSGDAKSKPPNEPMPQFYYDIIPNYEDLGLKILDRNYLFEPTKDDVSAEGSVFHSSPMSFGYGNAGQPSLQQLGSNAGQLKGFGSVTNLLPKLPKSGLSSNNLQSKLVGLSKAQNIDWNDWVASSKPIIGSGGDKIQSGSESDNVDIISHSSSVHGKQATVYDLNGNIVTTPVFGSPVGSFVPSDSLADSPGDSE